MTGQLQDDTGVRGYTVEHLWELLWGQGATEGGHFWELFTRTWECMGTPWDTPRTQWSPLGTSIGS